MPRAREAAGAGAQGDRPLGVRRSRSTSTRPSPRAPRPTSSRRRTPTTCASAIRQAFDHSIYLARGHNGKRQRSRESIEEAWGLTRRELEILTLVAEGHSNAQLARMLWVTEQTVKFHLSNIYRKLNVSNRTEASRWAQVHGLLPLQTAASTAAA